MRIKYVGVKLDGERAFKELTGIEWLQGDSHEVDDKHAVVMLKHPDVFAIDEAPAAQTDDVGDDIAAMSAMSDAQVREFAKAHGIKGIHHKWTGDTLREKVAFSLLEMKA